MFLADRSAATRLKSLNMNSGVLMIPRLERRLARLEAKFRPQALRAVIEAYLDPSPSANSRYVSAPLPAEDLTLQQGVTEDGEADISPCWSVTFFEGTLEQQNERLKEL